MSRLKHFGALMGFIFMFCVSSIATTTPASADQAFGTDKMNAAIEKIAERVKHKFEDDMRKTFAKERNIDETSLITSDSGSKCVLGTAAIEDGGLREFGSLSHCVGWMNHSYYGDDTYDYAYRNDYVVDEDWNTVRDLWYPVNIGGLSETHQEFTLKDSYNNISFVEVKKGYTKTRNSSTDEEASDGTFYRRESNADLAEATVSGFDFYLIGKPKVYIEHRTYESASACVETAPGYCGDSGVGKGGDTGTGVVETKPGNGGSGGGSKR